VFFDRRAVKVEPPNQRQPAAGERRNEREGMTNKPVDAGAPTAAAAIESLRAVTHTLTPAERLAVIRIIREGMDMLPPETDQRLRARINVARGVPARAVESMATALEPSVLWQQSANTTPEELRRWQVFGEHRPLFEDLMTFAKVLGYNLDYHHYTAVAKARDVYRVGRNLSGPEGLSAQVHLDAVTPAFVRGGRKRKKPEPESEVKK
jgi:hypothetical protein